MRELEMLKNNSYVKAYLNVINEDVNKDDVKQQFYNTLQLKCNNKLSVIFTNSISYYEQLIKKPEFLKWIELIKLNQNKYSEIEHNIDDVLEKAKQIADNTKSQLLNVERLNQYINLNIQNEDNIKDLKTKIDNHTFKSFDPYCPELFIYNTFCSEMYYLSIYNELRHEDDISNLLDELRSHRGDIYTSFETLYKYIRSSINNFNNKQVYKTINTQEDTGAKDYFDQSIHIDDNVLFFTAASFVNKHFYIGTVEKYSSNSLFIRSKEYYQTKYVIKKEDTKNRIVNLSKINDVDLCAFCANKNGVEI